jgi:glutathione S-transferase
MHKIEFYSWALSPFANKVQCYLLFLDIEYETIFVDAMLIRKMLPIGITIPVLTIDGESRNESSELGFWLNELYPNKLLVPEELKNKIIEADNWVTDRLINHSFRDFFGFDDPLIIRAKKRLHFSKMLDQTSPKRLGIIFRFFHMLLIGQTFVKGLIATTDRTRPLGELKSELAVTDNNSS